MEAKVQVDLGHFAVALRVNLGTGCQYSDDSLISKERVGP